MELNAASNSYVLKDPDGQLKFVGGVDEDVALELGADGVTPMVRFKATNMQVSAQACFQAGPLAATPCDGNLQMVAVRPGSGRALTKKAANTE